MALKRFELLTINSTVIAGVLILLTLSGLTVESSFFDKFSQNSKEMNVVEYLKFYFIIFIVLSIIPFAVSAIKELQMEIFLRRLEIRKKLLEELKKSQENKDQNMEKIIKKRLDINMKRNLSKLDDIVENSLYERDDATLRGIRLMLIGFSYLTITVILFAILRIFESGNL